MSFELVDTRNVAERRAMLEEDIITNIEEMAKNFYTMSSLNVDIRCFGSDITEHVCITKDKYGDVSLNLVLSIEVLRENKKNILNSKAPVKLHKF